MDRKCTEMEKIAQSFLKQYYTVYEKNRNDVLGFFHPNAICNWNTKTYTGHAEIRKGLTDLGFKKIKHTIDVKSNGHVIAQASPGKGIQIVVIGQVQLDDDDVPLRFVETFLLLPNEKSYFITNHVFTFC